MSVKQLICRGGEWRRRSREDPDESGYDNVNLRCVWSVTRNVCQGTIASQPTQFCSWRALCSSAAESSDVCRTGECPLKRVIYLAKSLEDFCYHSPLQRVDAHRLLCCTNIDFLFFLSLNFAQHFFLFSSFVCVIFPCQVFIICFLCWTTRFVSLNLSSEMNMNWPGQTLFFPLNFFFADKLQCNLRVSSAVSATLTVFLFSVWTRLCRSRLR